jgi:hypothetical protein
MQERFLAPGVKDELERAWEAVETASGPASIEAQNGAAAFGTMTTAPEKIPAKVMD